SNAIKFTRTGGVTVSVRNLQEQERQHLEVVVKDTGIGISKEDQERLFQEFGQASSASQINVKGTGIGLVLSRRISEALGGFVRLEESVLGIGTTFLLSIPVEPVDNDLFYQSWSTRTPSPLSPTTQAILG